ncbi:MAG: alpha-glucuronidase family glycosyl hydrolase [Gemmatimonadales bacterium]
MILRTCLLLSSLLLAASRAATAEDGSELWLRYRQTPDVARLAEYRSRAGAVVMSGDSPTLEVARDELLRGLRGILGEPVAVAGTFAGSGVVVVGTARSSSYIAALPLAGELPALGRDGFLLRATTVNGRRAIVVAANTDIGVLYGVFALLREMQIGRDIDDLHVRSVPTIELRMLDHWDNLDRTVERGYAGQSLWAWNELPITLSPRYRDYARANASIGINGASLTNVNANAKVLTPEYLAKAAAIASVLRPYGIRVFLTARFSAPIELGGLKTADPLDPAVRAWWAAKVNEIYAVIPDFGGFLVKANSEGQPGPQDYKRSHAEGANMFADALAPHGGVVIWRAFVYSNDVPVDRVMQAYAEFKPLDGQFRDNVMIQVKNGPLDFQPREPFSPLFGAMPKTPLVLELQITKEYLGEDTNLAYLGTLFSEVLGADTYAEGKGSTVGRVIDGSLDQHAHSAIAGVANIGSDVNWTGSEFNQANWYAFGRLAWDHTLAPRVIADEWTRMTFSNDARVASTIDHMLMISREAVVNYMTPLGLAHLMGTGHHYGPAPWVRLRRLDWSPVYYHRADSVGIGFDRTSTGSNAVSQYAPPVRDRYASRATVPDSLLLWFHHVPWGDTLSSGRTLWEELVRHYNAGVDSVHSMQKSWTSVRGAIDPQRYSEVDSFLAIQEKEARWWRDASLSYWQTFSHRPIPAGYDRPAHALAYYMQLRCPADPRKPRCDAIP